jgi:hypothetical protein
MKIFSITPASTVSFPSNFWTMFSGIRRRFDSAA